MARLEVYLPGDGSFSIDMSDEKLADFAMGLAKHFKDEGGSWVTFTPDGQSESSQHRWVPSSAGVALIWDNAPPPGERAPLSLVV